MNKVTLDRSLAEAIRLLPDGATLNVWFFNGLPEWTLAIPKDLGSLVVIGKTTEEVFIKAGLMKGD